MKITAAVLAGLLSMPLVTAAFAGGAGHQSLADAAKSGDRAAVQSLLNHRGERGLDAGELTAALIWAAQRNDLEMADLLLGAGANPKSANDYGATALYAAAASTD